MWEEEEVCCYHVVSLRLELRPEVFCGQLNAM